MEFILYSLIGSISGIFAGLLGVGGGLVIVPALLLMFSHQGFEQTLVMQLAVGTSLATIVVTSLSSIKAHHKRGSVSWPIFVKLIPGILVGAFLGSLLAEQLSSEWLQRFFAVFIILVGAQMAWLQLNKIGHTSTSTVPMFFPAGTVIGLISSMMGIGGGTLIVPYLTWHKESILKSIGTASACGLPISISGAIGFLLVGWGNDMLPDYSTGYLYWPAIIGIIITSYLFAPVGVLLAHKLPIGVLKKIFSVFLIIVGIKFIV